MDIASLVWLAGLCVFVGILIGGVGIGGVLLVPVLTYIFAIDVHTAIAAAMVSYLFTGTIGAVLYARKRSIEWSMTFWLFISAAPAAFLGAWMSSIIPGAGLEFVIAVLVVFAGVNALLTPDDVNGADKTLSPGALVAAGSLTGIGSALSGTGGPLVLVPLLVWLKVPALVTVGLSQAIQVPVAALATAGNYLYGTVDYKLGLIIAAGTMTGAIGGAHLAHIVSQAVLRRVVAWVLVAAGILIIVRISLRLIEG